MSGYASRSRSRSGGARRSRSPAEDFGAGGSGRSPHSPYEDRISRSPASGGRSGSRGRGERRRSPEDSPRRSRSPRGRSGSFERSRPRYDAPPRRGGGGGGGGRRGGGGDRDDPEPNKCLGVFGLSLYTTERELEKQFGGFGEIEKCQVVLDGHSGRSRGFAFVYFETVEQAAEAKKAMDGQELDGRQVRVDFSITKRPHTPTPGKYMGRPSRDFNRGGPPSGGRGGRDRYGERGDRYGDRDGGRYREERRYDDRDRYDRYDRYDDRRERDRYYEDRRRDDRYYEDRYESRYPPPPPPSYGKRPRPRSPSPYERDQRSRREYRSRSREYERPRY